MTLFFKLLGYLLFNDKCCAKEDAAGNDRALSRHVSEWNEVAIRVGVLISA